jgi:hypothetical protein
MAIAMKKTVYDELWYEVMSAVILYPMAMPTI